MLTNNDCARSFVLCCRYQQCELLENCTFQLKAFDIRTNCKHPVTLRYAIRAGKTKDLFQNSGKTEKKKITLSLYKVVRCKNRGGNAPSQMPQHCYRTTYTLKPWCQSFFIVSLFVCFCFFIANGWATWSFFLLLLLLFFFFFFTNRYF